MNLNQVTVPSLDLNISVPFYEMLGLKLIVRALPHYARFQCPEGGSTFSIHQTPDVPEGNRILVYFECEDLDQRVAMLKSKGVKFDLEPTDQPWLWREARLKDPDGNPVVLYYAGENRLDPPWKVQE